VEQTCQGAIANGSFPITSPIRAQSLVWSSVTLGAETKGNLHGTSFAQQPCRIRTFDINCAPLNGSSIKSWRLRRGVAKFKTPQTVGFVNRICFSSIGSLSRCHRMRNCDEQKTTKKGEEEKRKHSVWPPLDQLNSPSFSTKPASSAAPRMGIRSSPMREGASCAFCRHLRLRHLLRCISSWPSWRTPNATVYIRFCRFEDAEKRMAACHFCRLIVRSALPYRCFSGVAKPSTFSGGWIIFSMSSRTTIVSKLYHLTNGEPAALFPLTKYSVRRQCDIPRAVSPNERTRCFQGPHKRSAGPRRSEPVWVGP